MPATHRIDEEQSLIITEWQGDATDDELIQVCRYYLSRVKSRYPGFNELVDLRNATSLKVSMSGLIDIGRIAASADDGIGERKLALLIRSGKAFSLARAYIFYRNMCRSNSKQIETFQVPEEAYAWLGS